MRLCSLALVTAAAVGVTLALPGAAFAPVKPLFAALNGQNEIAQDGTRGAGDRNGGNGPIVVPLTAPETGDPGNASNCTTINRRLIRQIRRNPGRFYVNVHTDDFRDGAIRGQLFSRGGP
jgi:hypothetical protein